MASVDVEDFMSGALVTWLKSCLENPDRLSSYEALVDGVLLYEVLLQIDPEPTYNGVIPSIGNISVRIRNLNIIIRNIRLLYENEFCQTLMVLPDCIAIGREPESKSGLENMRLLLLLLLGCAVQCPNKKTFIERITLMNLDDQHVIVECIKEVTESQQIVLNAEFLDTAPSDLMVSHINRLVKERNDYLEMWVGITLQEKPGESSGEVQRKASTPVGSNEIHHHIAVELADSKARARKLRQELEEKSEALNEAKDELSRNETLIAKLRQEKQDLIQDARAAKAYRDEVDAMRERAERVEKLELELQRYREKFSDFEYYKTRVDELNDDNRILLETKEMLEDQLVRANKRGEHVLELESEIIKYKQKVNEMRIDQDANQEKLQELYEQNAELQLLIKSSVNDTSLVATDDDEFINVEPGSGDNSLSDQLTSSAQARALKLELENRRLLSTIESMKESSFFENSNKILDLEKEKKKMSLKIDKLEESCQRLKNENQELENLFKDSFSENKKLENRIETLTTTSEKQFQELQADKSHIAELEGIVETVTKEKHRVQCLMENLQRRLEEQDRMIDVTNRQMEDWRRDAQKVPDLQRQLLEAKSKMESLERENSSLQKEISRIRECMEAKDVALDQYVSEVSAYEKQISSLTKELDETTAQISRLHEVERESQELASRAAMDKETLMSLQNDLVTHKLNMQQLKTNLEKLGFDICDFSDPSKALERIKANAEVQAAVQEVLKKEGKLECNKCKIPDAVKKVNIPAQECHCKDIQQEFEALKNLSDSLSSENAKLQVSQATLQSQIMSLSTQHTALQLANSQLAAEKEELVKEQTIQQAAYQQLLLDQQTLQSLHEQLNGEYESLQKERDSLKIIQRDLRSEIRILKERCAQQEAEQEFLEQEKEKMRREIRSYGNLRAEHSSLKDDFRNLFTSNEKVKQEYRTLQEEYRILRNENGNLKLKHIELQGELSKQVDHSTMLEVELSKLSSKCEVLLQMNSGLEDDRRSLMDHVSVLLTQYHELLTHSLEDKEQYHIEEKMFTDKLNNLCRQKEKLEEKIMEHYRKLESCSTKKKSFGASLVKRVRKAGSDFINKVPRNRRSWHEDTRRNEIKNSLTRNSDSEDRNESDTSIEDLRLKNMHDSQNTSDFTQSTLSLGSAGTRRAVYLSSEESRKTRESSRDESVDGTERNNATFIHNDTSADNNKVSQNKPTPLLIYNRITTVLGNAAVGGEDGDAETTSSHRSTTPQSSSLPYLPSDVDDKHTTVTTTTTTNDDKEKKENSIWYEYGCV